MDRLGITLEVLNDLIEVNGQRIWSYQAVLEGPTDQELRHVLDDIIAQGQRLQEELEVEFVELADDLPARGNPTGTILQAWNTVKSIFARKDAMPINEFFDTGERALLKAYRYALRQADIMPSCRKLITRQKAELSAFYRQYRQLYRSHDLRGILLSSTL